MKETSTPHEQVQARVISRFGNKADIELKNGEIARCHIRRSLSDLVCGDMVIMIHKGRQWVVDKILPRRSLLERPVSYEGLKPVAANIDQLVIVKAILPEFSAQLLDRYLALAESIPLTPIVIFNKIDLLEPSALKNFISKTQLYKELGYQCLYMSSKQNIAIEELALILNNKTSIFVGQSGVGKSSLLNCFFDQAIAATDQVSENSGLGTHTTTVSRLYHLRSGGDVIDSPGIREFPLTHLPAETIRKGFVEIEQHSIQCRFRNCSHLKEPHCAVKYAVEKGEIDEQRYANYCQIMASLVQ